MKLKKYISVLLAVVMLTGFTATHAETSNEYKTYENLLDFIANSYIDETVTKDVLIRQALDNYLKNNPEHLTEILKATFDGLDEYSSFYTMEEFQEFYNSVNRVSCGIGVLIKTERDYVTVLECTENGGAAKAGVLPGDKIIRVDGQDVVGKGIDFIKSLLSGEINTTVNVTMLRDGNEVDFTITRGIVRQDTVFYSIYDNNIGYIRINTFAQTTANEFAQALEEMDKENVTDIILDLRDNPGGITEISVAIAKMVVPEGIIITLESRNEEKSKVYMSDLKNPKYKFAVLVNENTASASEVLASAMQESGVAVLIGDTTYGKALAQETYVVADAYGGIKLTTAHYLTRSGKEINKVGIDPDIHVLNIRRPVDNSRYTQFDYINKCSLGDVSQNVRAAEERLSLMGYSVGDVDDEFTGETEDAIKMFQSDNDLFPYGVLDITTQVRINNNFLNMQEYVDKQLEAAYNYFTGETSGE